MRVVPNLYPAFERQEVVVHTPRHARSLAELNEEELALVAEAWRLRRKAVPDGYLHALVNEGREAGASLPHTWSGPISVTVSSCRFVGSARPAPV